MDAEPILEVLRQREGRSISLVELMRSAELPPDKEKELKRCLKGLVRRGLVEREPGRRYRFRQERIRGRVFLAPKGRAHIVPEGGGSPMPLLYEEHKRPQHQDVVEAELQIVGRSRRRVAHLVELLERPRCRHVGILRQELGASFVELDPQPGQPKHVTMEVLIPPGQRNGASVGQLVEVEYEPQDDGRNMPLGHVRAVLGEPGERATELSRLIVEHGLDRSFPKEAVAEAEAFGDRPSERDMEGRRDVRDLPLVTIDGETAKDFDDAVCAVRNGAFDKLYVAIADVSHYVRLGKALDEEAFRRGTSTYLTDRAIPMLPETLSNGLCSLNPSVDRLCMLVEMTVDDRGRITDASFHRAVMRSQARLTYTRVADALAGKPDEECERLMPVLLNLARISRKLLERRLRRGSVDLDLPEPQVIFDERGLPVDTVRRPRNDAHRIIEDLMIATNEAVARHFEELARPAMYRVHDRPDPERLENFARLCATLGVSVELSEEPTPAEVSGLLLRLSDHENGRALHGLLLRSLAQARYSAENKGHFGLASTAYLHFTSPIRRYPDLIVHRLLKQIIDDEASWYTEARLEEMAGTCSDNERKAMLAERASLELDRTLVARKFLGERLPARITAIQGFGMFATVIEPFIEGLIPVQSLPSDYYEPDAFNSQLTGAKSGINFRIGDPIEVEVVRVDVSKRQVELHYVASASQPPRPTVGRRKPRPRPRREGGERKSRGPSGRRRKK
ncbi:MAG: ribonuclease R [Myxococcota bacterium]